MVPCLFVQRWSPHINAHTADYDSDGCVGSKHDSANRRHHHSSVTFQMFAPPNCELHHIQHNLAMQFLCAGPYLCYIGTLLHW